MQPRRALSTRTRQTYGGPGILRSITKRLWLRRDGQCGIWPDDTGAGTRRFGRAQLCERAVGTVHVSDLRIRQRRAERDLAAPHAEGGETRLLWIDRAGFRLEPRRNAHSRS